MLNLNQNNSNNISIRFRDRDEFIQEFKRRNAYQNSSYISSPKLNYYYPINNRWNYLHDLDKLYKSKIEEKREKQRLLTEEKEMKECTFNPHLNKNISYIYNNLKSNNNINDNNEKLKTNENDRKNHSSFVNLSLIERQKAWISKKKNDLKEKESIKHKDEMEECFFTPEINDENAINKVKMNKKTINLLEDPESYSMYIKRLKKKREQVKNEKKIERLRPGYGNIWKKISGKSRDKSYDIKNDYSTKLSRSRIIDKQNKRKNKYINTEYSLDNFNKGIKKEEIDKNQLYEDLYKKSITKLNDPYGKEFENDNNKNRNEINNLSGYKEEYFYNHPIQYGKAIDILHNKLYSINLESEEDEDF